MRTTAYLFFILLAIGTTHSQGKKYLISPHQEVIPMGTSSAEGIISGYNNSRQSRPSTGCANFISGFDIARHPIDQKIEFYHRETCGQWYVVPADGTIDTVYFRIGDQVGPPLSGNLHEIDSTVLFRIFSSNITPIQGPGVRPGPYHPPCTSWGYYLNTNDVEDGIAAFVEDATPPQQSSWISTNQPPFGSDPVPSFPPFNTSIWGLQGFPVQNLKPNTTTKVVMADLVRLVVHQGDVIFISIRVPAGNLAYISNVDDYPYEIGASNQNAPYPSPAWKFYEHDSATELSCSGKPISQVPKGWVARGSFSTDDTLAGTVYNIWYSMTATSNTPPVISNVDQLHNTTSQDPETITVTIFDCDADNSAKAGVKEAWIKYTTDSLTPGSVWTTTPLTFEGNDQYEFTLPGLALSYNQQERYMYYKVIAADSLDATDSSAIYSYRVVSLQSYGWYKMDTVSSCTPAKIASTGNIIDTSQWFISPRDFWGTTTPHRGDDGTSGPFAITNGFMYFGDTMHFAWVGVNGGIALSKTATDTIDLNAGGFYTNGWDFPFPQHHSRSDTLRESLMPKAFMAPYWADWIAKRESPLTTFGHVRYLDTTDKFVVEWDSLGEHDNTTGQAVADFEAFRVVLNKTDNSIEFQYDEIGHNGLDSLNLTGIQCDSNYHGEPSGRFPPYALFNKNGYPTESHLHSGLCIHYMAVCLTVATFDGWNLLSLPTGCGNPGKWYWYPTSLSSAFIYSGGYVPITTLTPGYGFWLKFSGAQAIDFPCCLITSLDIPVDRGWNIIGSISCPVPIANITADAGTGITPSTPFFGYSPGYFAASAIAPGYGYFVRANGSGKIHLACSTAPRTGNPIAELDNLHKITISQKNPSAAQTLYIGSDTVDAGKYEMPPAMPDGEFDVRFRSNSMVETYPNVLDPLQKYEYPITINTSQYPLTIRWEQPRNKIEQVTLILKTDDGKVLATMNGTGRRTLNEAGIKRLIISVHAGIAIPKVFALGRNYPNPFNPTTRFTVEIPRSSQVEVNIYDILGRKIVTLMNGEQAAGYHTMEWDGRNTEGLMAPTGIYFIKMNAPEDKFSAVQKIMLMK